MDAAIKPARRRHVLPSRAPPSRPTPPLPPSGSWTPGVRRARTTPSPEAAPDFPSDLPSFSPSLLTRDLPIWFERSHPFLSVFFLIYLSPERPSLRSPRRRAVAAVVSFADWILCLISCGEVSWIGKGECWYQYASPRSRAVAVRSSPAAAASPEEEE